MAILKATDYKGLNELMKDKPGTHKIGNNTTAFKTGTKGGQIHVFLYDEMIASLTWQEVKVIVEGDNIKTATTRDRVNQLLPEGYEVVQKNKQWFVNTPSGPVEWAGQFVAPVYGN